MTTIRCRFAKHESKLGSNPKWNDSVAYVCGDGDTAIALEVDCFPIGNPIRVVALSRFKSGSAIWIKSFKLGEEMNWLIDFPDHKDREIFSAVEAKHAIKVTLVNKAKA